MGWNELLKNAVNKLRETVEGDPRSAGQLTARHQQILQSNGWHFYESATGSQHQNMILSDFLQIFGPLDHEKRQVWFAWRKGWPNWAPVISVPEIMELVGMLTALNIQANSAPAQAMSPALPVEKESSERRRYQRHPAQLKIVLIFGRNVIRTFTRDVSRGGIQIYTRLPRQVMDRPCEIYISSPDFQESILFQGQVIIDERDSSRLRFLDKDLDQAKKLILWVMRNQKSKRKKAAA